MEKYPYTYEHQRLVSPFMKILYYSCLFYVVAHSHCLALAGDTSNFEWGPVIADIQISARLKDGGNEIRTNQPIDLLVRVRNLSTNQSVTFTKWVGADAFPPTWSQQVISRSGNDPAFGILKDGSFSGSISLATVAPNGFYEYQFRMGILSGCKTNDVYTIVAKRMVGTNFMVTSNPLELKVVPGEWKPSRFDSQFP